MTEYSFSRPRRSVNIRRIAKQLVIEASDELLEEAMAELARLSRYLKTIEDTGDESLIRQVLDQIKKVRSKIVARHFIGSRQLIANEKPVHWVTAAARRVLAGEDFDAVMQDLAKDMGLHDTVRFNAVKRELTARVEQERGTADPQQP